MKNLILLAVIGLILVGLLLDKYLIPSKLSLPGLIPSSSILLPITSPGAEVTAASTPSSSDKSTFVSPESTTGQQKILKDVGEAYLDHFGLTPQDFQTMNQAGVTIIEGNFDICASDEDVAFFLNQSYQSQLQVIMPAGSGEAEWGYACGRENFPLDQLPV